MSFGASFYSFKKTTEIECWREERMGRDITGGNEVSKYCGQKSKAKKKIWEGKKTGWGEYSFSDGWRKNSFPQGFREKKKYILDKSRSST